MVVSGEVRIKVKGGGERRSVSRYYLPYEQDYKKPLLLLAI